MTPTIRISATGLLYGLVALGSLSAPSLGGELVFRDGHRIEAQFTVEGQSLTIAGPDREYRFRTIDFRSIEPDRGIQADWRTRRDAATASHRADERHAAVIWALRHGLTAEALELLETSAAVDPTHHPTAHLAGLARRLAAPCPDPDPIPIVHSGSEPFRIARSSHLLLLHQTTQAEAQRRLLVLEDVLTTYHLLLAELGLRLDLPRQRLVIAWFAQQRDYQAFLRDAGASAFLETDGYYHPTRRLVVFFDQRSTPASQKAQLILSHRRTAQAGKSSSQTERLALQEAVRRERHELGSAAHELVHALVRQSGLAVRHETIPVWLHEGLAMQFEVVIDGRWAGVGVPHPIRLSDWERSVSSTARLARVVSDEDFGRGFNLALYTQAWALVRFLWNDHPDTFVALLDQLRTPRLDNRSAGSIARSTLADMTAGGLTELDQAWHAATDALARSSSAARPAPPSAVVATSRRDQIAPEAALGP